MSAFDDLARAAWQASRNGRDLDARLLLGAAITALAPEGARPIIVGGTAVDFWAADTTGGSLEPSKLIRASQDIDIVVLGYFGDDGRLRRALHESKMFRRTSDKLPVEDCRGWIGTKYPVLVEVIDDELAGDPERVATVEIGAGVAYLWGKEDTLWQYAENSMRDRHDWARALAIRGAQELDWDYIAELATRDRMPFLVQALQDRLPYEDVQALART